MHILSFIIKKILRIYPHGHMDTYVTHLVFHHHEEEGNVKTQNTFLRTAIKYLPAIYHGTPAL